MRAKELFEKLNHYNDGTRTLFESIAVPEVNQALIDWNKHQHNGVLIGGCALSFYVRPRTTMDVDVLFLTDDSIPKEVSGFKRTRPSAFQHNKTHVEIELVTSLLIGISQELTQKVFDTAMISDNVKIASPSALVALKLHRFNRQDQADIEELMNHYNIDLQDWPLSEKAKAHYEKVLTW
jgi:hypothetical protein